MKNNIKNADLKSIVGENLFFLGTLSFYILARLFSCHTYPIMINRCGDFLEAESNPSKGGRGKGGLKDGGGLDVDGDLNATKRLTLCM